MFSNSVVECYELTIVPSNIYWDLEKSFRGRRQ